MAIAKLTLAGFIALSFLAQNENRPRVFVSDKQSWEIHGGFSGVVNNGDGVVSGQIRGGAASQTADIIKSFNQKCGEVIVTMKSEKADYALVFDRASADSIHLTKSNHFAVYKKDGDVIKSGSTRTIGGAVKDMCEAIKKDWEAAGSKGEKNNQE